MSRSREPYGKGWKPLETPILVGLTEPVWIERWGYEVDRQTVLDGLCRESLVEKDGLTHTFNLDRHTQIARRHPRFEKYRAVMGKAFAEIREALGETSLTSLLNDFDHAVIENFVRGVVAKQMKAGRERKLWKAALPEAPEPIWRGPWAVVARRVVKTGTYYPSSGGRSGYNGDDYEYDPAVLDSQKTHVLFLVERVDPPKGTRRTKISWEQEDKLRSTFAVEKANTYDWTCEMSAQKLMEEPVDQPAGGFGK